MSTDDEIKLKIAPLRARNEEARKKMSAWLGENEMPPEPAASNVALTVNYRNLSPSEMVFYREYLQSSLLYFEEILTHELATGDEHLELLNATLGCSYKLKEIEAHLIKN